MTKDDIIRMAREAGAMFDHMTWVERDLAPVFKRFAALVAAHEREKVADWMIHRGYATGHGDTIQDLIKELNWQAKERERKACAKMVTDNAYMFPTLQDAESLAAAIFARGMQ